MSIHPQNPNQHHFYRFSAAAFWCTIRSMKRSLSGRLAALQLLIILAAPPVSAAELQQPAVRTADYQKLRNSLINRFSAVTPQEWGEAVTGVKTRIAGREKLLALTFDACGSAKGMQIDRALIEYLEKEQIAATLFINGRWIEPNRQEFGRLAANPLFEIANHGFSHKPASVSGRSVYGISGTKDAGELVDEIELNARRLAELTGRRPRFYRSGTAYYDEIAVRIANALDQQVAGFSLLGDAGATYSSEKVKAALLAAKPGDIVIMHFNHPESGTAAGVMAAIPELKKRGYRFVRLSDLELE
jgi:peptidoglycan/xylan/chitin deacetylase (PgdA/CDA1 family)